MEKDIPLKIEVLSKEQNEKLRITSPEEIKFVMNYIAEKGNRVALYCSNGSEFILTTLLAVDENGLWLEKSPNEQDNRRITNSERLIFVSSHLQVKVQFVSQPTITKIYKGHPTFHLPWPKSLYRMQRREYYRLTTPVVDPLVCVISQGEKHHENTKQFIIMDVSCGGVGLVCVETDSDLVIGRTYPHCQIELPKVGIIKGAIEVKNIVLLPPRKGITHKRAGCEFKNLDKPSIILLQRYITSMQRIKIKV